MIRQWKPKRPTVELGSAAAPRPSRIRREPPPAAGQPGRKGKALTAYTEEREAWTVAIGVFLFALAFAIIIVGISDYTAS